MFCSFTEQFISWVLLLLYVWGACHQFTSALMLHARRQHEIKFPYNMWKALDVLLQHVWNGKLTFCQIVEGTRCFVPFTACVEWHINIGCGMNRFCWKFSTSTIHYDLIQTDIARKG
jgi:hypothetical protein